MVRRARRRVVRSHLRQAGARRPVADRLPEAVDRLPAPAVCPVQAADPRPAAGSVGGQVAAEALVEGSAAGRAVVRHHRCAPGPAGAAAHRSVDRDGAAGTSKSSSRPS
ncbi:MAG: hypothetical protein M0Z82_10250 [Actinomycetota bacterium]|nr:hypothetical protein [Actinomycetota bacterium]